MAPPVNRHRPIHSYNPFPFERPAISRNNNKNVASRNGKPVTSDQHPTFDSTPKKTHNVSKPTLPPSSSHKVLRPTGAYPGQFAPLTKRTSLPPPGEMTQHAEENLRAAETREARKAAERKAEKKARKEKKAKKKEEEAKSSHSEIVQQSEKMGGEKPEKKVAPVKEERKKGKAKKSKTPGLVQVLEMQSRSAGYEVGRTGELTYIPFTARFVSMKVQRSRQQRQQELKVEKSPENEILEPTGEEKKKSIFPFLNLPDTTKTRIYKLLVVETKLCIWPATKAGREQPDISMVCKEIRNAILPIYYGENTFAVDIAPPIVPFVVKKTGSAPTTEPLTGLVAVQKWAEVLSSRQNEDGKWFGLVNNWCFSYQDPVRRSSGRGAASGLSEGRRDFIVSVQITAKCDSTIDEGEAGRMSKTARAGPIVEVHREAACIMPGWSDCGRCMVQTTPEILVVAVQNWLRSDRKAAEGLQELVLKMRKTIDGLAAACCTKTPHNGELRIALP